MDEHTKPLLAYGSVHEGRDDCNLSLRYPDLPCRWPQFGRYLVAAPLVAIKFRPWSRPVVLWYIDVSRDDTVLSPSPAARY